MPGSDLGVFNKAFSNRQALIVELTYDDGSEAVAFYKDFKVEKDLTSEYKLNVSERE